MIYSHAFKYLCDVVHACSSAFDSDCFTVFVVMSFVLLRYSFFVSMSLCLLVSVHICFSNDAHFCVCFNEFTCSFLFWSFYVFVGLYYFFFL